MNELRQVNSKKGLGVNVPLRPEVFDDRDYLVAPVVLLVEGVHNGYYYSAERMEESVQEWDGKAVPILHPMNDDAFISVNDPKVIDECSVGRLFNVTFEEGNGQPAKLKGEVWVDRLKVKDISPESIELMATDRMEVSTGLRAKDDEVPGVWEFGGEAEEYFGTLQTFHPDHLALLPGEVGACSRDDGCGVRANEFKQKNKEPNKFKKLNKKLKEELSLLKLDIFINECLEHSEGFDFLTNAESFEEVKGMIQMKLNEMDKPNRLPIPMFHYLVATYDNYFIYEVMGGGESDSGLFKLNYSYGKGIVEFDGDPKSVRKKIDYPEIKVNKFKKNKEDEVMGKLGKECCGELIKELIANEATQYTEEDRGMLEELPEDILKRIAEVKTNTPADDSEENDEGMTEEDIKKVVESNPVLKDATRRYELVKEKIIKELIANKRSEFTEDQLKSKGMDELEKLAKLAQVDVDFTLKSAPVAKTEDEDDGLAPDMPKETDLWALKNLRGSV